MVNEGADYLPVSNEHWPMESGTATSRIRKVRRTSVLRTFDFCVLSSTIPDRIPTTNSRRLLGRHELGLENLGYGPLPEIEYVIQFSAHVPMTEISKRFERETVSYFVVDLRP